jgi:hypothetical protein
MQLQGELGKAPKYTSALRAFPTIVREEGFLALYKGVQPALLRQATYGSLRIGLYEPVKSLLGTTNPSGLRSDGSPSLLNKILAGVASGAIGSAICNPTDVVKVRMQAAHGARYRGVADAFTTIYKLEGFRGLYRGVSPTVQRAAVVAAVELASYDECKGLLVHYAGLREKSLITHFAASISAGFLVTIFSSPLDVVKSRVMNQPVDALGRGLRYSSTVDCFRKSVQAEGLGSLWKGFWPNFGALCDQGGVTT